MKVNKYLVHAVIVNLVLIKRDGQSGFVIQRMRAIIEN
jgi:hypothetical protein